MGHGNPPSKATFLPKHRPLRHFPVTDPGGWGWESAPSRQGSPARPALTVPLASKAKTTPRALLWCGTERELASCAWVRASVARDTPRARCARPRSRQGASGPGRSNQRDGCRVSRRGCTEPAGTEAGTAGARRGHTGCRGSARCRGCREHRGPGRRDPYRGHTSPCSQWSSRGAPRGRAEARSCASMNSPDGFTLGQDPLGSASLSLVALPYPRFRNLYWRQAGSNKESDLAPRTPWGAESR